MAIADNTAADFAEAFYEQIEKSTSNGVYVADILRDIRRRFYTTADPTYLAYALYGSSNLRISTAP